MSLRPTRIGTQPPEPFMPLRPSHDDIIAFICCAAYRASTQPVSRLVALPLPHRSSVPENVVLVAASWQRSVVAVGSVMV